MGVLGWSAEQALDTPMPYIHAALEARADYDGRLLRDRQRAMAVIFGVKLVEPEPEPPPEEKAARDLANMKRAYRWFRRQAEINARRQARQAGEKE